MIVFAHGNVDEYCAAHNLQIGGRYEGQIQDFKEGPILVTDQQMEKNEYYYLKYKMLRRKVELISIWFDDDDLRDFVHYMNSKNTRKTGGRLPFGFYRTGGEVKLLPMAQEVVQRIFELRDHGKTYKEIQADSGVHHLDGRRMPVSTIQVILRNRGKYETGD